MLIVNIRSHLTVIAAIDRDLLVRASRLYYVEDRGQAEIATLLGISRPGVSRLLQRARDEKIVEIRVRESAGGEDWSALERRLGIKELHVATDGGIGAVGTLAARYFERAVRSRDVIGLTAGTTLSAFVQAVTPPRLLHLEIVPLVGALWDTGSSGMGPSAARSSASARLRRAIPSRCRRGPPRPRGPAPRERARRCLAAPSRASDASFSMPRGSRASRRSTGARSESPMRS